MPLDPGQRIGPYEVIGVLGAGGMGEVYRASDTSLKRQVAIKVLPAAWATDADRLARFQREAEVLASLNHPNIAAIYGVERAGAQPALVMELVEGPTLADRLARGAMPVDEALGIARQIAAALEAAHDQGIVHRDLKPANIKLRSDGTVKLLDFGLAKAMDSTAAARGGSATSLSPTMASPVVTGAGMVLGTAAYMSPEQARGRPADHRSDIWSFGVVLVEMVTGRPPFEAETVSDSIAAVLTRDPDLDAVPPALRRLVRSCLARDPRERLRHIGDALPLVEDPSPSPVPARGPRVRSWQYATLACALIGLALAAWVVLRPRPAGNEQVTRFYVEAPPGAAFNYTYTASLISPDGRQLVFRVATSDQAPALWLRPLDSFDGQRLAGTDGADFPFWSPDGRSIGFFAAGKLKRVDASGGAPIVLAEAWDADSTTAGGSWNAGGVIVFGSPLGIYRVSASGGTPALIAPVDSASGETGYGNPQFLPDGDRFLISVRSEERSLAGLYVTSLAHPQQKTQVLATRRKALFVTTDEGVSYVLYLQDRTLLGRRIDGRTLALAGEPVPIASNVALFPPGFHASFWSSASGSVLAYRTEESDRPRLTWVYPDGKRQNATDTDEFYTHVRVSADGARAALELVDATGNMDVWTLDFARGVKTRQTFDPTPDRAPTWSPDGRDIAFSSYRTGVWQIVRKDLVGGRPEEQLTTGPADKIVPTWSRDGRYLLYIQIGSTTAEDIWALPLEGVRTPFPILQGTPVETNPALSPDGKWLAFESSQFGRPEIFVTRFPESGQPVDATAPRWQISTQGGSRPRWSGDGGAVFYVALDDARILRADVRTAGPVFESNAPRVFAEIPVMPVARSPFDLTADGRVLLLERTIDSAALSIVTNWRALMK